MNNQQIEKPVRNKNGILEVHSIFHTIQGEGPFSGTPAIFIRLAGCNLQCPMCDTDYTSKRIHLTVGSILAECVALNNKGGLVVITGGEPFRQPIGQLVNLLVGYGYYVQIETNGTLQPPPEVLWSKKMQERKGAYIVCSPKAGKLNSALEKEACAFKYVLDAISVDTDGLPIRVLDHSAHPRVARAVLRGRPLYLQPADTHHPASNELNIRATIKSCMEHGYILQLQTHKYLNLE